MGGGAWPFLVGGVICLVDSDNERDSTLLTSRRIVTLRWLVCIGEFAEARFSVDRVSTRIRCRYSRSGCDVGYSRDSSFRRSGFLIATTTGGVRRNVSS